MTFITNPITLVSRLSLAWIYDTRGRATQETKTVTGSGSFKTQWGYNSADLVAWMKYPADNLGNLGEQLLYTYHAQGWLNTAINYAGYNYVQGTAYDAAGRVQLRTLGTDVLRTDYVYFAWTTANGQGRLQKVTTGIPSDLDSRQDLRYTYDAVGNVLTIKDYKAGGTQTQTFTYDVADRLDSAIASGGSGGTYPRESYVYDVITGNLSIKAEVSYTYLDDAHRHAVTHLNGVQKYWYDANGNMTQRVIGGSTYNLSYDPENRLVGVSGAATATFTYDGDGKRVKATVGGTTTVYINNYLEWTGSTSTMVKYIYAGNQRVAMRVGTGATRYFLLSDHLGSTTVTANSSGAFYAELRFKAWGETRYSSGTTPTTLRYTGQRQETSLGGADGLYYYGARWIDPVLGRWIQPDSLIPDPGNPLDWDRFSYVRNNPVRNVDPSGHRTCNAKQAKTGDETCNQNYNAGDLKQSLSYLYGWEVKGKWTVEELAGLADVGKNIREYIAQNTGEDGNLWINTYLGNAVFRHGIGVRSFTYPYNDINLRRGETQYWVTHELGHLLDNNFKGSGAPATFVGGGTADAMLKFVGGNPGSCFPRFQCSSDYIENVAGYDPWEVREYGNNSVADDFAQTFARVITNGAAPFLRSTWMKAFLGVLATHLP